MIQLRVLGLLDLRNASGNEVHSVLAQPKRTALLAYLALAAPSGYLRRDTLLALFWPELDAARARGALNTAIYHLRQSLGADLLVNRGDEEVAIAPGRLGSDCGDFEAALANGRLEAALETYGGDLLQGFFVSGVPGFEQWLEMRRGELRGRAVEAARALAERAEAESRHDDAVRWTRRLLAIAPTDEPAVRRLITLLDRGGDRAGALRESDEFARRLWTELEMEPAAETLALVAEIRAGTSRVAADAVASPSPTAAPASPSLTGESGRTDSAAAPASPSPAPAGEWGRTTSADASASPSPTAVGESGRTTPAALSASPSPAPAERSARAAAAAAASLRQPAAPSARTARARRSPWLTAAAGLLLATLALVTWGWLDGRSARTDAADSTVAVAVLPFTVRGEPGLAYLGEGMVDLLSMRLSGAPGLRSVDPRALLTYVGTAPAGGIGPSRARQVAGRFGASFLVLGEVAQAGGQVQLSASVYARDPAGAALSRAVVAGSMDSLPALVDGLAQQLVDRLPSGADDQLARRARVTTRSVEATQAFLEGERAFRAGRYLAAADAFRRSTEADTSFAFGYYRWSVAATWADAGPLIGTAADAADRHREGLPELDRLLLVGWRLQQSGRAPEAERLYRSVLARRPEDVEAWNQLGEVLFHWNPSRARPVDEARRPFEQVLLFEPHNTSALIHLARIAGTQGRFGEMDSLAARALAEHPEERSAREMRVLRAYGSGDTAAWHAFAREARLLTSGEAAVALRVIVAHTGNLAGAADFARMLPAQVEHDALSFGLALAEVEAARGRWGDAERRLAGMGLGADVRATEYRAMLATLPTRALPPAELRRLRDALPHPGSGPVPIGGRSANLGNQAIYPPRALYLRGMLSARAGDVAQAAGYAAELDRFASGNYRDDAYARDHARTLHAQLALQQGDPRRALAALGVAAETPDSLFPEVTSYPLAQARWVRAEALRALGRLREALSVYASFPDPLAYDVMYVPLAHLRRGELHERLGERGQAAREYARALAAWRDADPTMRPQVDSARAGLARVGGR